MRTRDFLVGLTFFGLLTILAVSTIFFADFTFVPQYEMTVLFENAGGLFEGAEVRVDGLASGRVRGLERVRDRNVIRATLKFDEEPILYHGTTIEIVAASPLGGTVVEIDSGHPVDPVTGEPNPRWYADAPESLEKVWVGPQATIGDAIDSIKQTASQIDRFVRDLNEREVPENVGRTVAAIAEISEGLKEDGRALDMILGDESAGDVRTALERIRFATQQIAEPGGALAWLLGDPASADDVRRAIAGIRTVAERISAYQSGLGWLLNDDEAAVAVVEAIMDIRASAADIKVQTAKIAEAQSGLGWLLGNEESAGKVVAALTSLEAAAGDIKTAAHDLTKGEGILQMLLTDASARKEVRNSIKALSDFIETTRENAPITTFAGIILSPF